MTTFQLSEPTAFSDLNKNEGRELDYERDAIELKTLKYKHFRSVLKYPEEDQMHQLMLAMTGLTEDDIGELTPSDAAEISHLIFQSMKKYMELGQQILRGMEKK
jgi:hypothetical protein